MQASAQNFARELMEMPSNLMTPSLFVEAVQERAELVRQSMSDSAQLQIIPRQILTLVTLSHILTLTLSL